MISKKIDALRIIFSPNRKKKYFCIGRNKTGTTSLGKLFRSLGYIVGDQRKAELLAHKYYFEKNFKPIIKYCKTAEFFQDVPFSWPNTFRELDKAFPNAKFILTVRDSSEQWYSSLRKFHAKLLGTNGEPPTAKQLRDAEYATPGFMYNTIRVHGTHDDDPYNKETMIAHYEKHNSDVIDYFSQNPEKLLVINLSKKEDYPKLLRFIGHQNMEGNFPWENKTF